MKGITVRGIQSEVVSVEISGEEARKIALAVLHEKHGLKQSPYGYYIDRNNMLCYEFEEWYGSHSSFTKVPVREATEDDKHFLWAVALLHKRDPD